MADRLKDSEDLRLEALFRSEPVPDDGFAEAVVSRIRRRLLVQRYSLPVAFIVGALIAAKPFMQLAGLVPKIFDFLPRDFFGFIELPLVDSLQGPTIILGIILLGAAMMIGRMLED